ncbi:hypothetical protein GOC54_17350 [Sinorhizobium meliloti]|nr:hypothetical protein [Sinorhizobium meliloti]MDX0312825.1 hypothetical protein [Sinorhizobium meliloti]
MGALPDFVERYTEAFDFDFEFIDAIHRSVGGVASRLGCLRNSTSRLGQLLKSIVYGCRRLV